MADIVTITTTNDIVTGSTTTNVVDVGYTLPAGGGGGAPTGSAGGDLGGTYPNPTVTGTHLASPLPVNQGGTGSTARNFAGLLTPTAVKTSGYTAAAGDCVPCDTTSAGFTVTLPAAPPDLTVIGVKIVIQGGANAVTVAAGGSDVFNKTGGAAALTLSLLNQGVLLQYKSSSSIWYVVADDLALSQLDARYGYPQNIYNVRQYGATGNGSTDDLTAIQNAISAAQTAGGGIVLFPEGTYAVSGTPQITSAPANIIMRGTGGGSVILLAPSSMTANGHTIGIWVNGGTNVTIEDLCIDGNFANVAKDGGTVVPSTFASGTGALNGVISTAPAAGTQETWVVNAAASTASAAYSAPFAVKVDSEFILVTGGYGTTSWTVKRGFGQGNGGGVTATHTSSAAISSTNTTLFDATITSYGSGTPKTYMSSAFAGGVDASTYLQYRAPIRISNAENVTVQRCLIRNSVSAGILADATAVGGCTDILVTGNRIHHTWDNGVYFHKGVQYGTADSNLISDTMYNCLAAVYCDHILINNNNGRQAGPSFSDSGGMQVNGSSNCGVTGNVFDQCQFYGVSVQSSNETNITGGASGNEVYASTTNVAGNLITNCHAADYSTHTSPGVNFNGAIDTIVADNTIQNCDYGVSIGQKAIRSTLTGNRIALCTSFGVLNGNSADVIKTVIRGNLITKCGNSGIFSYPPLECYDNIITANVNDGVNIASPPSGLPRKTDYIAGNVIADNTDSGVLLGSSAACVAVIERNTFTNGQGVIFTDGVTNGTTTFTSATAAFTSADVGSVLIIANQGTGGTTTATTIASVTNGTTVVLNATPAGTQTGLTFQVGRGPCYFGDGSTTTASNSVLTSATAAFTSADAGVLVVLFSADAVPSVLGVTTVSSVTSGTQVTLGSDFGTIAACGFFINRAAGQTGKAVNNFNGYPVIMRNNTIYGLPEYQGAGGVVKMVQPSSQWLARRAVADHAYTLNLMDQLVVLTSMTASRTITLPNGFGSATLPYYVDVKDESGSCSAANSIVLSVSGGGTVDGAASKTINTAYGRWRGYSTGSNWFTVKPATDGTAADIAALGAQAAGSTGYLADAGHVHPTTGLVTGVTAADTSVVVGGTSQAPTIRTNTLDVVAAQHAAAADWSNNSHKITSLLNGSAAQDAAAFGQIPVADATAANILIDGSQAAGANGKWADSGHVHPSSFSWTNADQGLLAQSFDVALVGSSGGAPTSGTVYFTRIHLAQAQTVTNILCAVASVTSQSVQHVFFGLYNSTGTQVAVTADRVADAGFAAVASGTNVLETAPLTGTFSAAAGLYWVGFLMVATTPATIGRVSVIGGGAVTNAGLAAGSGNLRFGTWTTTAQTTLPGSFTPTTQMALDNHAWWVALT